MKRVLSFILAAVMLAAVLAACGAEDKNTDNNTAATKDEISNDAKMLNALNETQHTLYFKDKDKSGKVVATFSNSSSDKSEEVEMVKCGEDSDSYTFSCEGNVIDYNVAKITFDDKSTKEFSFNKCTSGWYNSEDGFLPYTEGEEINYSPEFDEVTLDCNGYEKDVHIWKPEGYDASSDKKYATIYVLDGQSMAFVGKPGQILEDSEVVTEQVKAMTSVTGYEAIVVAVDTFGNMRDISRNDELVPDIGETVDHSKKKGTEFAKFVAETLVPYIQKNYNVYTDALHTSVAGVSLGGLESFYITVEYPELFGTAGAFSSSFWIFEDNVWRDYLGTKSFDEDSPLLYIYTGGAGGDTGEENDLMVERLNDMGYPQKKLAYHYNEWGGHHSGYWRNYFSEFLEAMVFQKVEPIQNK